MTKADEIIEWCARAAWKDSHDGAECPDIPSETDLAAWSPGCPAAAQAEAREAMAAMGLIGPDATGSVWSDTPFAHGADSPTDDPNEAIREVPLESWRWQAMGDPEARKAVEAELREHIGLDLDFDAIVATLESHVEIVRRPRLVFAAGLRVDTRTDAPVHGVFVWHLPDLHRQWRAARGTDPDAQPPASARPAGGGVASLAPEGARGATYPRCRLHRRARPCPRPGMARPCDPEHD